MNEFQLMELIKEPHLSEKVDKAAGDSELHIFEVSKEANKIQIRQAIELMFKVEVASVNVVNVMGKVKRFGRSFGKRPDWKKAYVKLKPGHSIQFTTP